MLDHCGINVSHFGKAREFYSKALVSIGYRITIEFDGKGAGIGKDGKSDFWFKQTLPVTSGAHIAFSAQNHSEVDKFYQDALAAGGRDNGPPGIREHYHPKYYGAFVLDPDGNNIEVVCHQ